MASNRIGRINEEIQREMSTLIRTVKDPRVTGMISVTAVIQLVQPPGDGHDVAALIRQGVGHLDAEARGAAGDDGCLSGNVKKFYHVKISFP